MEDPVMTDAEVRVELVVEDLDAEEIDRLAANLRRDLRRLDVDGVTRLHEGPTPPGARGAELLALGTLIVVVGEVAGALADVVRTVRGWVGQPGRTARLEIDGDVLELPGPADDRQEKLVDEWLTRNGSW
jgi:hypothetical protein